MAKPNIHISEELILVDTDQYKLTLQLKQQPAAISEVNSNDCIVARAMDKRTFQLGGQPLRDEYDHPMRKSTVTKKPRKCVKCGKEFNPQGNRQVYCSEACGLVPKWKKNLSKDKMRELDNTLNEIEQRRKSPYEVGK